MPAIGTDWWVVDGVATAWFDAPSLIEGSAVAGRIVELSAEIVVDLRAAGMRVRLDSDEHAEAVSSAAQDLGLGANPAVLQHLSIVFESANPTAVRRFWQRVLDLPASSAPQRIRGCRASLSSSSTPPTSPQSARSG